MRKRFEEKTIAKPLIDVRERRREKRFRISEKIGSGDIPQQTRGAWCRDIPGKHDLQTSKPKPYPPHTA